MIERMKDTQFTSIIYILTKQWKLLPMPRQMQESMLRQTLHVCVAFDTQNRYVIRNSVFNGKTQIIEGDKQSWPISFY